MASQRVNSVDLSYSKCNLSSNAGTQCNLILLSQTQRDREHNKRQHVKATQTLKADRVKSTQTTNDLRCQCESDQSQSTKRRKRSTPAADADSEHVYVETQTRTTSSFATTQTDDYDLRGSALEKAVYLLQSVEEFSKLSYKIVEDKEGTMKMIITDPRLTGTSFNKVDPVFLCLDEHGQMYESIILRPEVGPINMTTKDSVLDISQLMDHLSSFFHKDKRVCEGFQSSDGGTLPTNMSRHVFPSPHLRSAKCDVFVVLENGSSMCVKCKYSLRYFQRVSARRKKNTPSKKRQSQKPESKCNVGTLTPASRKKRLQKQRSVKNYLKRKAAKAEACSLRDVDLSEQQDGEMKKIVDTINEQFSETFEEVIAEGDTIAQEEVRGVWERDSRKQDAKDNVDFFRDQEKNRTHAKSNRWSTITYRIALAVYCRSPAAYEALKAFHILQLPSVQALRGKTSKFNDKPGVNHAYLQECADKFHKYQHETEQKGDPVPKGDGVLIFDEVKVIDKLAWNSRSSEFVGVAMSSEDSAHLTDIFRQVSATGEVQPAQYMLQFLWRDMTAHFDVIGPYYAYAKSIDHHFVMGCLLEVMGAFECYGFGVSALVCDGASENLKVIKQTMGHTGTFGYIDTPAGPDFTIEPKFQSPFQPEITVHWVICPSHQLKSMIAALYASRPDGAVVVFRIFTLFQKIGIIWSAGRKPKQSWTRKWYELNL